MTIPMTQSALRFMAVSSKWISKPIGRALETFEKISLSAVKLSHCDPPVGAVFQARRVLATAILANSYGNADLATRPAFP